MSLVEIVATAPLPCGVGDSPGEGVGVASASSASGAGDDFFFAVPFFFGVGASSSSAVSEDDFFLARLLLFRCAAGQANQTFYLSSLFLDISGAVMLRKNSTLIAKRKYRIVRAYRTM